MAKESYSSTTDNSISDPDDNAKKSTRKLDIDEAIERVGDGWFQTKILLAAGLCFGSDAGEVMLLSFLTEVLRVMWKLTDGQAALIVSSVFLGQVSGTLLLGFLGDYWGRRKTFLLTSAILTVFGFLSATTNSFGWLVFFRVMVGFGIGGMTVPFELYAEFLVAENRGMKLLRINYFWTVGELLVIFFAYITLGVSGSLHAHNAWKWKLFVVLSALPVLLSFVLGALTVPESPRWLLAKGRKKEALQVLRSAAKSNGKDPDKILGEGTVLIEEDNEAEEAENTMESIRMLFQPTWRSVTIIIWLSWIGWGICYYGVIQLTTKVFSNQTFREKIPTTYKFDYFPDLIASLAEFVGVSLVVLLIDVLGRVRSEVITFGIGGFMILGLAFCDNYVVEEGYAFIGRVMFMAGSSTSFVHVAEILPTSVRATGHSAANLMARVGGSISPYIVDSTASSLKIGLFMLVVGLITSALASRLPETKGKKLGRVMYERKEARQTEKEDKQNGDAADEMNRLI